MKTQLLKNTIATITLVLTFLFSYTQNCTNCDGNNTITPENYSSALGIENTSTGLSSLAVGKLNTASGMYSMALGYGILASGNSSFSAGLYNTLSGGYSIGIGNYLEATQIRSFILGTGSSVESPMINNIPNSLMVGFGSTKPTFFIKEAPASDKTGTIGIGDVTDPLAKLHIKSDFNEEAAIFIEPYTWDSDAWAEIRLGNNLNAVKASYTFGLQFKTDNNYIFNSADANVGIGVLVPNEKLEVNGNIKINDPFSGIILQSSNGQCWKTTVDNSGNLTTISVDCETAVGEDTKEEADQFFIYPNPTHSFVIIENKGECRDCVINIYNMSGVVVLAEKMKQDNSRVSLKHFTEGEYIIRIFSSDRTVLKTEKIIKQ